jgi:hypothetical protein
MGERVAWGYDSQGGQTDGKRRSALGRASLRRGDCRGGLRPPESPTRQSGRASKTETLSRRLPRRLIHSEGADLNYIRRFSQIAQINL